MNLKEKIQDSLKVIEDAIDKYYPNIALACSFGKDSVTTLHLTRQIEPRIKIIFINTGLAFPETIEFRDRLVKDWDLYLEEYTPLQRYEVSNEEDRDITECCNMLKVEPTKRALQGLDAWITGLRADETAARKNLKQIESDLTPIKLNPIIKWTNDDVWNYIKGNNVPYHPLYDNGFVSIGCEPCTRAGRWGEFERAGRWGGKKDECGIHTFQKGGVKNDCNDTGR